MKCPLCEKDVGEPRTAFDKDGKIYDYWLCQNVCKGFAFQYIDEKYRVIEWSLRLKKEGEL